MRDKQISFTTQVVVNQAFRNDKWTAREDKQPQGLLRTAFTTISTIAKPTEWIIWELTPSGHQTTDLHCI